MKKIFFPITFIFFACIFFSTASLARAEDYYVSPTGSATWANCRSDTPLSGVSACSVATANANASAGNVIYFRAGTYSIGIAPVNSGSEGNLITFQKYANETVTLNRIAGSAVNIENKNYIKIDGFRIIEPTASWIYIVGGDHNIIQNCYMQGAGGYSGINLVVASGDGGNYNQILNNEMIAACPCTAYCGRDYNNYTGPSDLIQLWGGNYNLIEGNTLRNCDHSAITLQKRNAITTAFNVIKNNTIENRWHSGIGITQSAERNLIENNVIKNSGADHSENYCTSTTDWGAAFNDNNAIQINSQNNIIRFNKIYGSGTGAELASWQASSPCSFNRVFNNTFYNNAQSLKANDSIYEHDDNVFKNNIFYTSSEYLIRVSQSNEFYFFNNNFSSGPIVYANQSNASYWNNNLAVNPSFVNVASENFVLNSNSSMIDTGGWLTTIKTSVSNSSTVSVNDSSYFTNGFGIVAGDTIQFEGSSTKHTITNITNNTITVSPNVTVSAGRGVALEYSGSRPDIGAHEYIESITPPIDTTPPVNPFGLSVQ